MDEIETQFRHVIGCKKCFVIIFDGTPGEIYEAEKHEEMCKDFEYEDLYRCTNCQNLSSSKDNICDCLN